MTEQKFKELENRVLRLGRTEWEDRAAIDFCVEADMSRAEVKRLRGVLEWYAGPAWQVDGSGKRPIDADRGSRAAKAVREET